VTEEYQAVNVSVKTDTWRSELRTISPWKLLWVWSFILLSKFFTVLHYWVVYVCIYVSAGVYNIYVIYNLYACVL